ncbi:hypothetical protein C2E23DRAFT_765057 [Lenzites betulinus]|nr:hypothetical protein C2E23DRAFT_765057 [Lenzites betulinus]
MMLITKRVCTVENAKRHQPYDLEARPKHDPSSSTAPYRRKVSVAKGRVEGKTKRLKDIEDALSNTLAGPSTLPSTSTPARTTPMWSSRETLRDVYLETVNQLYPYYTPKNDFEILVLSGGSYKGVASLEGITQFLEKEMKTSITVRRGTRESVLRSATKVLDTEPDITGLKPRPGDPGVFIRPLPNSEYSIRLFPGSKAASEYCLDFVLSATGKPVNSPFKFNLLAGPGPTIPVGFAPTVGIQSLERSFGVAPKDMRPGAEKFVLRDGQLCTLQRPGHKDVQFIVPMRRRPEPPKPNVDMLELPQYV